MISNQIKSTQKEKETKYYDQRSEQSKSRAQVKTLTEI